MPTSRRQDDENETRYNLADATHLLGFKDRRTLNHWMRAAGIEPVAATYGTHQKLLTRRQIEAIRAYITQQGGVVPTPHVRMDALTPEAVDTLIRQLRADILAELRVPEPLLVEPTAPSYHRQTARTPTRVTPESHHPPLPAHLVSWRDFARRHRIRETVVRYHVDLGVERGGLPTVVNPGGWRGGIKIAFDQAGRDAFHAMFAQEYWGGGACPYCTPDHHDATTDDHDDETDAARATDNNAE